jgi:hypothetical protein
MKTLLKTQKACFCKFPTSLTALLFSALGAASASAQFNSGLIDFNYNAPNYGFPGYTSGPGAIGSPGDQWNSVAWASDNPVNLITTDGSLTSAIWTINGGGGLATPNLNGAYAGLLQASTAVYSATITGLTPNRQYDLYLYEAYWGWTYSVNGVDFTTPGVRYGTIDTLTDGNEYDVETVTADPAGTLTFTSVNAQFGTPYMTSWQLTPVPEPSVMALLTGGTALMLFGKRRYSRAALMARI